LEPFLCIAVCVVFCQRGAQWRCFAHVDFTTAQKQTVYQSIAKTQKNNAAPVGFRAAVGALVPSGVEPAPVPATIAELIPQAKGLEAALVEGEVILVDPQPQR
jgi:hypothetical protein